MIALSKTELLGQSESAISELPIPSSSVGFMGDLDSISLLLDKIHAIISNPLVQGMINRVFQGKGGGAAMNDPNFASAGMPLPSQQNPAAQPQLKGVPVANTQNPGNSSSVKISGEVVYQGILQGIALISELAGKDIKLSEAQKFITEKKDMVITTIDGYIQSGGDLSEWRPKRLKGDNSGDTGNRQDPPG